MDISLSDDQIMLADSVGQLLTTVWPRERMRSYVEDPRGGDDSDLWQQLARSDFQSMFVPEANDGGGATLLDLLPVMEKFGYALAPTRFVTSAVVSTYILAESDESPLKTSLLEGSNKFSTVSVDELRIEQDGDNLRITGQARYVPDIDGADVAIVVSSDLVVIVPLASPTGITIEPVETVDASRRLAHVHLSGVTITPENRLTVPDAADLLTRVKALKTLATTCDSLGGAQRALDMAVGYSKERFQFGRAIGSFQSLQHLMADAYVAVENLRSTAWYAADALQRRADDQDFAILAASVLATKTYLQVSDLNVQIHGGMGFTKEVDAYLFAARAKVNEVLDGTLGERLHSITSWLQTADLEPLVEYLGGSHRQLEHTMFGGSPE
ncbi:acyl-CoA dehydrogenase family protein [Rhodococcus koreensis]